MIRIIDIESCQSQIALYIFTTQKKTNNYVAS